MDEVEELLRFDDDDTYPQFSDDLFFGMEAAETNEKKQFVLIIYDVVSNKKRIKLAKLLCGYGFRIQKSCFEAELSRKKIEKLVLELRKFGEDGDSIRIYRFQDRGHVTIIGRKDECRLEDIIVI